MRIIKSYWTGLGLIALAIAIAVTIIAWQPAQAASFYSVTDLSAPLNSSYSYAEEINNAGQAIVNSGFNDGRAFIYNKDRLQEIKPLAGDTAVTAIDINDRGRVLASSNNPNNFTGSHPLIYFKGKNQRLKIEDPIVYDINNRGQVVGGLVSSVFPSGAAFIYRQGKTDIIIANPEANQVAYGLNDRGEVVGRFESDQAFLYTNGTVEKINPLPGDTPSQAEAINNQSQVVGTSYRDGNFNTGRAFI